jgi:hypothetical protein
MFSIHNMCNLLVINLYIFQLINLARTLEWCQFYFIWVQFELAETSFGCGCDDRNRISGENYVIKHLTVCTFTSFISAVN